MAVKYVREGWPRDAYLVRLLPSTVEKIASDCARREQMRREYSMFKR